MKKYELIKEDKHSKLFRIRALKDFSDVKKGDLGGFVESEKNLSQKGNCWIYYNAMVYDDAQVYGNAVICDESMLFDNAQVFGEAIISDYVMISGNAQVFGNANVYNFVKITDNAKVYENCTIFNNVIIKENAIIKGYSKVCGFINIKNNTIIANDAEIVIDNNYINMGPFGDYDNYITIANKKYINIGNEFSGNIKDFRKFINNKYNDSESGKMYLEIINNFLQPKAINIFKSISSKYKEYIK